MHLHIYFSTLYILITEGIQVRGKRLQLKFIFYYTLLIIEYVFYSIVSCILVTFLIQNIFKFQIEFKIYVILSLTINYRMRIAKIICFRP